MKKRNPNYYFNDLNELLTKSEAISEEMHPFFEQADLFFKEGGEFTEKTAVIAGFEKGMVDYNEISNQLSALVPNVRVIGMHKKLVKQFEEYVEACQAMVEATKAENESAFRLSEKNQELLSEVLGKTINRIVKLAM
ncbi:MULTISPECIES: hypothetical protein [unclassified Enterococcus]|uniref:hypothetical protein n=1 Tax=unclassified Enterococcus TaxID=2608891 RepID=UPI001557402C|nr:MULTISPECIES: hypothetical protein [unclassified Enterococcus]MBS7576185.1 hypothetical protein [Enterococcus sp. MMGLQ5-2]MBS7583418.1 hypothetical protein [Enterococcus sp. MMGLQ5-1]NPD11278.1 hypothetical protein [Enterococcus sp. MMGLQ5-1]NPD36021.1 hypothetical protein [Enterococcus sp. MMGLQ5-2]